VHLDDDGDAVITLHRRPGTSRQRGQALVEFAFVFPVIVLLAFAMIDIGRAVFAYNTLTAAARQAVRVAMVNQLDPTPVSSPTPCDEGRPIEDPSNAQWSPRGCAVLAGKSLGVRGSDVTIAYRTPPGTTLHCSPTVNVGCLVSVQLVYRLDPITPLAGTLVGPITISATSEQPVERLFP
jgi:hypothetical protein